VLCVVDTSVWIDFFRGKASEKCKLLVRLIDEGGDIAYTGVILTEVMMGFKKEEHIKSALELFKKNFIYLESSESTYLLASKIYRTARKHGLTIRSSIDCIISASALEHKASLLENDKDFVSISKICDLNLIK